MMAETFVRQAPTHTADSRFFCELRPAACELRLFYESVAVKPHP